MKRCAPHRIRLAWLQPDAIPAMLEGRVRLSKELPEDVRVLYVWSAPERAHAWGICLESGEFGPVHQFNDIPPIDGAFEMKGRESDEWYPL